MTADGSIKVIEPEKAPKRAQKTKRGRPSKYPFDDLKVGGCFKVPEGCLQSVRQIVSNKNSSRKLGDPPTKYSVGQGEDGAYYVWRDS